MPQSASSTALAAVARVVAEAQTLSDAVSRLAVVLCDALPFDRLHLLRLDRTESLALYVVTAAGDLTVSTHRISDTSAIPTPLDQDSHSRLICPVRHGPRVHGALWVTAMAEDVFTADHQELLDGVADLVALAVSQEALRLTESVRRERIDSLDRLLHTVAESLEVRAVFSEISDVVRGGLPHDVLALTSWGEDARSFRVYALAGVTVEEPSFWEPMSIAESDRVHLHRDPYLVQDVDTELAPESNRGRVFSRIGVKSLLRVPLPLGNDVFGSLFFGSHATDRYTEEDIDFGKRVADHLALALSHQRLAEAIRRDEATRETAARLEAQVATLTRELESRTGHRRVIGRSRRWKDVLSQAARVAQTETTVLLTGESGTGKEVVARFVHHGSRRAEGPFIAINCAALPDQLLESELFGHERGAFTGAVAAKPGRIEQANGGVLFLDEVGEMAPTVQAKLLRVLEEREFLRLGGTRLQHADIRVIAATNRDLHAAMRRNEFREDLYYRLGVFEIALPPLRDRPEDILELAFAFLEELGESIGKPSAGISREAKDQLIGYSWPGNVRELRNAIERAVILADGAQIRSEHLPVPSSSRLPHPTTTDAATVSLPVGGVNLEALERSLVAKALTQARHNKTRAAKLLGLTRAQLYSRIEKYGLAEGDPQ